MRLGRLYKRECSPAWLIDKDKHHHHQAMKTKRLLYRLAHKRARAILKVMLLKETKEIETY